MKTYVKIRKKNKCGITDKVLIFDVWDIGNFLLSLFFQIEKNNDISMNNDNNNNNDENVNLFNNGNIGLRFIR